MLFGGPDPDPKGTHQLWWSTAAALAGSVSVIAVILIATRHHSEWHPKKKDIVIAAVTSVLSFIAFVYTCYKLWKGPPPDKSVRYRETGDADAERGTAAGTAHNNTGHNHTAHNHTGHNHNPRGAVKPQVFDDVARASRNEPPGTNPLTVSTFSS
eukprot:TRINITY_DN4031_c0_g1_i1.p2 TRINITY_DN4031_c0_g1~~TRINITY_DN4031_c0_g1_i1.p2  ORF type:complete len:155 (+),score=25.37 TRINITY_DN4031_c0_g1_i1:57-521(+)